MIEKTVRESYISTSRSFNRRWAKGEALPIEWIPGAGNNSNTDRTDIINELIRKFLNEKL